MSQPNILRQIFDTTLPPGPKWQPKDGAGYDLFLDGLSNSFIPVKTFIDASANVRNPFLTTQLSDLEKDFGILSRTNLSESVRRDQLAVQIFKRGGTGGASGLQSDLIDSGFDVQVHINSPAVDPAIFLDQSFQLVCGDPLNAFAGDPGAYAGRIGGYLLVNGPVFEQSPLYLSEAGGPNSYAGDPELYCGRFDQLRRDRQEFPIPTNPDAWPFIFFVGGDATRDGSGALTNIEQASIPSERIEEFEKIILGYKSLHSWAGIVATFT
jgi:hypothetical protein